MKSSCWILIATLGSLTCARSWGQADLPSPSAEPGRLEAPQPEASPEGAGGDAAATSANATPAPKALQPAPADSPVAARLLADRTLKGGGPKFALPLLRGTIFPRGLAGWLDLSVGVSAGRQTQWQNVALNGQLELASGLRAHYTGVYREREQNLRSEFSLQEGYVEGYGFTPVLCGRLGYNLKLGRTANLSWPYPDPNSLFDQTPFLNTGSEQRLIGYEHLTGVLDWEHPTGFGFHAGMTRRFTHGPGGSGDLDLHLIDYYGRYRHELGDHFNTEIHVGGLNSRAGFTGGWNPRWAVVGGSVYFGRDWDHGSAGILVERLENQSTRYGFRVNLTANPISNLIGHFLGRYHRENDIATAQVPIAQLWTGQSPRFKAPPFAERVGQIETTRIYRTGTWLQRDAYPLNYEYILRRTGETKGGGLVRVVHEGPRALTEFGMMDSKQIPQAEVVSRFRQDVSYDLYRIPKLAPATLKVRLINKLKPSAAVANATIEAVDEVGRKQSFTAGDGQFAYTADAPKDRPVRSTLKITAPGFLPETAEVQLAPGDSPPVEIQVRPATGLLAGVLLDGRTGDPIPEVEVVITGGGAEPNVLLTDEKGQFEIEDLQPGRYAVATHAPRFRDQRMPAEIVSGVRKQVEIRLGSRPASVAGRVLTASENPVPAATVTLRDDAGNPVGSFTTLSDGSFGATGLKPGTYTLQAKASSGKTVDATIKLTGGEISTVDLKLP